MQQRPLGRSGLAVSRLALGTMTWGRDTDADDAAAQLKTFRDAGGTLLDTADVYADGEAESVIGALVGRLVPREELVIATKAGLRPGMARRRDGSRGHLLHALDTSLQRLGTDHVDLWQVHGYDPDTPLEETLSAIDTAVSTGRARYAGVSNYSGWQTARAATWQGAWPGRAPLVSTQVEYSLLERGIEREVVPACTALGIGILPWSPLGRGVLTGKYRTGVPADSRAASPHFERFVSPYLDDRCAGIVEAVATAAGGLGVSPLEVALAWVRDRPGVIAPVLGARTVGQLLGALQTEEIVLPREIRAALDDVSAPTSGYPERQT
ncbi:MULTISPECIES: aldo/keto reductase [Dactylosporangium]|uniref:Oxidoreductase n=2 Tax=Dactylosporangium TaxID=35753 RepID=A0A9W6NK86_9ACTN|nr:MULTISPECIES: aldo/keto reductase [Dactylosporangium]UAB93807.1 aldo/keto reductase [Dactylosporangium vinaceum]UWZ42178.1 aldo/keto reductase [Dactylosporangium matsuzakiense]GLK99817.1 oxidoreductase [Dactylosporangium matsuzakiense]